jgi:hypothetical protein
MGSPFLVGGPTQSNLTSNAGGIIMLDLFGLGTIFWLFVFVFGLILAIAWIVLPLALIGTKPLLRQLIAEVRRTNALLEQRRTP